MCPKLNSISKWTSLARRRGEPAAGARGGKAMGVLAKTDVLDARVLARFAAAVRPAGCGHRGIACIGIAMQATRNETVSEGHPYLGYRYAKSS